MNNLFTPPAGTDDPRPRDHRKERRQARRKAALAYALRLVVVAAIPAMIPAWRYNLPEPAPTPAEPRSMEQPPYDNTPAEPYEGLSNLKIQSYR